MVDRHYLFLAQAFYLVGCFLTFRRLQARGSSQALQRMTYLVMLSGFVLHTTCMYMRGQTLERCPLTNLFEAQVFVAWGAVLFYLIIGPSYRVSFLGAFTAPLVLALCLTALFTPIDVPRPKPLSSHPSVEFHAAIAILACGAFALAFVVAAMYLHQERQLKKRRFTPAFLLMPPIEQLDLMNFRLLGLGFAMLTLGMIGGFVSYQILGRWNTPKFIWAVVAWLVYASVMVARLAWSLRGRKTALVSMMSFAFVLVTFWGVSLLSDFFRAAP